MNVHLGIEADGSGPLWLQAEDGGPTVGGYLSPNQVARIHEVTGLWLAANPGLAESREPPTSALRVVR